MWFVTLDSALNLVSFFLELLGLGCGPDSTLVYLL